MCNKEASREVTVWCRPETGVLGLGVEGGSRDGEKSMDLGFILKKF